MLNGLEKTLEIASRLVTLEISSPSNKSKFISVLTCRILDGATTCYILLSSGLYSFVPVIIRTIIEALAQANQININDNFIDEFINYNNRKLRSCLEEMLKCRLGTDDQKKIISERSKKAKDENLRTAARVSDIKPSKIVKEFGMDTLDNWYSYFTLHSHNDFNELIKMYYTVDGTNSYIGAPKGKEDIWISIYARIIANIVYLTVELHHLVNKIPQTDDYNDLARLIKELASRDLGDKTPHKC